MAEVHRRSAEDRRALKKLAARVDMVEKELGKVKSVGMLSAAALMALVVTGLVIKNKEALRKRVPTSLMTAYTKAKNAVYFRMDDNDVQ